MSSIDKLPTREASDGHTDVESVTEKRESQQDPIEQRIDEMTGVFPTNNKVHIIADGVDFFSTLEREIQGAKQSIEINVFSWAADTTGERCADLILDAKRANPELHISIRVDRLGCLFVGSKKQLESSKLSLTPKLAFAMMTRGVSSAELPAIIELTKDPTKIYEFPVELQGKLQAIVEDVGTEELLLSLNAPLRALKDAGVTVQIEENTLSHMDHSKIFIFDATSIYTGGMNIGDEYSGGYDAREGWNGKQEIEYWKDYMVRMEGPASEIHRSIFFDTHSTFNPDGQDYDQDHETAVRVLHNSAGQERNESTTARTKQITFAIHTLIDNATDEIIVEHAYIMDPDIVERLINAAERGVSVRLIRSMPENAALDFANEKFFKQLENRENITIIRSPRVLHAKLLHVDGKYSIIGSANLTRESLHFHEETAIFFASGAKDVHRDLVQSTESGHAEDIAHLIAQSDE